MRTKHGLAWLVAIAGMLQAAGLAAQDASAGDSAADLLSIIEESSTVEAAARHPQSLAEAPAHVTIITRKDIEESGFETIGEAIASAAGFFVRDDLNYTYLGVRGFAPFGDYGSHVLLMINGHPMIEPIFSSAFFQRNLPLDVRYVQRIEIVRGPASALYGTNAVLAVVNVITTKATESGAFSLGTAARSTGGWDLSASAGWVDRQGFRGKISGTVTHDPGFDYYFKEFDDPSTNFGRADGLDRERTWSLQAHMKRYGWSFSGLVSSRAKQIPTASWETIFNDDRLKTEDIVGFLDSKYDRQFTPATHLSGRVTFDWYSYNGVWPSEDGGEVSVMEDPHKCRVLGGEVVVSSQALGGHYAIAGLSLTRVLSAQIGAHQTLPEYHQYVDIDKTDQILSAFAQDEVSLGGGLLTGILGIRYDHYRSFGDALNPRLGVVAKSKFGATKLLYGRSFRAPTLYERYYDDAGEECAEGTARANPDLGAEHAYIYELVHDTDFGKRTHATVSAFYYKLSGLIEERVLEGGCLTSANTGNYRSKGVEAEVRGVAGGGVRWSASYSLTSVRNRDTGERLAASPDNLATVSVVVPLAPAKATFGVTMKYIGGRLTKNGHELDPAFLSNATLSFKRIVHGLTASISARNLFNAEHSEPAGPEHLQETLPQDERTFMLKLGWEP